jgi:hypothetical protein
MGSEMNEPIVEPHEQVAELEANGENMALVLSGIHVGD